MLKYIQHHRFHFLKIIIFDLLFFQFHRPPWWNKPMKIQPKEVSMITKDWIRANELFVTPGVPTLWSYVSWGCLALQQSNSISISK